VLLDESLVAVLPERHRLAAQPSVRLADLADENFSNADGLSGCARDSFPN
jgi:DNA-binding transcriptional LysR family regulator